MSPQPASLPSLGFAAVLCHPTRYGCCGGFMLRGSGSKVSRNHGCGSVAIPGARAAQAALNGWRLPVEPFEERAPNDQPDTGRTLIEILDPPQGHFFDRKQNSFLTLRA